MKFVELVELVADFHSWTHSKKILLIGWYIHHFEERERFSQNDVRLCYESAQLEKPSNISPFLRSLRVSKPKRLLVDGNGFYVPKQIRDEFKSRYGQRNATIAVVKLLSELPGKIPNFAERVFLEEALECFRHKAFRAAIVMTWNLAFDHFCDYVFIRHLTDFNLQLPKSFPKARITSIRTKDDFSELKESEVIQVCRSANIITNDLNKILVEKLGRRNTAAHPSSVEIVQVQAEDFITDLINNVVLRLV